jgi:hypothetical protein
LVRQPWTFSNPYFGGYIFYNDNVIVTVFDTAKKKRLIVDGWHRAAALTMACEDGINIPEVRIIECAGNQVNVIFPCDIHQLV